MIITSCSQCIVSTIIHAKCPLKKGCCCRFKLLWQFVQIIYCSSYEILVVINILYIQVLISLSGDESHDFIKLLI